VHDKVRPKAAESNRTARTPHQPRQKRCRSADGKRGQGPKGDQRVHVGGVPPQAPDSVHDQLPAGPCQGDHGECNVEACAVEEAQRGGQVGVEEVRGVPGDAGRSKAPSNGQSLACGKRNLFISSSLLLPSFQRVR
jgi:hypothetical protein